MQDKKEGRRKVGRGKRKEEREKKGPLFQAKSWKERFELVSHALGRGRSDRVRKNLMEEGATESDKQAPIGPGQGRSGSSILKRAGVPGGMDGRVRPIWDTANHINSTDTLDRVGLILMWGSSGEVNKEMQRHSLYSPY